MSRSLPGRGEAINAFLQYFRLPAKSLLLSELAFLPRGNFAGRRKKPFLFVDCGFYPGGDDASVRMFIQCDEGKSAAVGEFRIRESMNDSDLFVGVDPPDEKYSNMTTQLIRACPSRGFSHGDFMVFRRLEGRTASEDEYQVHGGSASLYLTNIDPFTTGELIT
ncbi:hypothetical protein FOZ63_022803 [Perkinsus olseni]|uniref:Uncharacterized protein n=1 Tax=Perkinsus olseni TaxID=32597 RepID=A0A7J6Q2Z6_PEROL|nr:hypothetical protein FOZ62_028474 [Perkinsus olseni]KAF4717558.1 hypothetical protein FOZ63_022803 [Perkinsus olseni]